MITCSNSRSQELSDDIVITCASCLCMASCSVTSCPVFKLYEEIELADLSLTL